MPTCPNCRHAWTTAKKRKAAAPTVDPRTVDVSGMTNAALYAFRKETAPAEDIRFMLENLHLSPGLRVWFQGLKLARPNLTRAEFYRQLWELKARWTAEKYWERVIVPATRLERRKAKARARMTGDRDRIAA